MKNKMPFGAKIYLYALRCEYIKLTDGGLTDKGKGFLSPKMWRAWFRVLCFFDRRYGVAMYKFLKETQQETDN